MTVEELTVPERLARARETLLRRGVHAAKRARRARVGSNERETYVMQARVMGTLVHHIDSNEQLREAVARSGWHRGWRRLHEFIAVYIRDAEAAREKFRA